MIWEGLGWKSGELNVDNSQHIHTKFTIKPREPQFKTRLIAGVNSRSKYSTRNPSKLIKSRGGTSNLRMVYFKFMIQYLLSRTSRFTSALPIHILIQKSRVFNMLLAKKLDKHQA
jgi:hypothetical protein